MVAVPAATPVIVPSVATVATAVSDDDQAPPVLPFEVNCVVPATQIACVPDNVPAFGAVVTVTLYVAVAFAHPPVPTTV